MTDRKTTVHRYEHLKAETFVSFIPMLVAPLQEPLQERKGPYPRPRWCSCSRLRAKNNRSCLQNQSKAGYESCYITDAKGSLRVAFCLYIKTRLREKSLTWKCVPPTKVSSCNSSSDSYQRFCHTWKSEPYLQKSATLGKMRHTWKNMAHLDNVAHLKMRQIWKVRHSWKNAPHLENKTHLEKRATLGKWGTVGKNAAHLEICGTLGKMRHTWKSAAHLEKCGTLGKVRHTWKSAPNLENE